MLILGWLSVLLGVLAILWADGAFAKIDALEKPGGIP